MNKDANGLANFSTTIRAPKHKGFESKMKDLKSNWTPMGNDGKEYDGVVTIRPNANFTENGKPKPKSSVVFHELAESFERTTNKLPYDFPLYDERGWSRWSFSEAGPDYLFDPTRDGAHDIAKKLEANFWQKSDSPGAVDYPVVDVPATATDTPSN